MNLYRHYALQALIALEEALPVIPGREGWAFRQNVEGGTSEGNLWGVVVVVKQLSRCRCNYRVNGRIVSSDKALQAVADACARSMLGGAPYVAP